MSTLTADPGFPRGQVLGITKTYYDAEVGDGSHLLGVHKVFADTSPQSGQILSNETVECVAVKNTTGAALLPKTLVRFSPSAVLTSVDLGANATDTRIGIVDEYLPAAGAAAGEVLWVVVKGPTVVTTTGNAITAGASVSAHATTRGKVEAGSTLKVGVAISDAQGTEVRLLANTHA